MLDWIFQNHDSKMKFEGKWKGKGTMIAKNCEGKLEKKNINNRLSNQIY